MHAQVESFTCTDRVHEDGNLNCACAWQLADDSDQGRAWGVDAQLQELNLPLLCGGEVRSSGFAQTRHNHASIGTLALAHDSIGTLALAFCHAHS
jgi:hypothetical protein